MLQCRMHIEFHMRSTTTLIYVIANDDAINPRLLPVCAVSMTTHYMASP
jgi:hypothetical protein